MKKSTLLINFNNLKLIVFFLLLAGFSNNVFSQNPPPVPGSVIANPDTITCGGSSTLIATTTGTNIMIRWWDSSSGGAMIGSSSSGANFIVYTSSNFSYYAESYDPSSGLSSTSRVAVQVFVTPVPIPTSVMVYPDPIQCGSSTNLFASTNSGIIRWWDSFTGGNLIGSSQSGVFFNVYPPSTMSYYAEAYVNNVASQTFIYTGSPQSFTVPYGITSISVDVRGGQGSTTSSSYGTGGFGGRVQASLSVTPFQSLLVYVGGQGVPHAASWNGGGIGGTYGGGGGGGSDIRINGSGLLNRIIVAGGGGGAGYYYANSNGGAGGDSIANAGLYNGVFNSAYCGSGGSQSSGGAAASYASYPATAGSLGYGGNQNNYGGGGGGGYFGGGAGALYGGGGGGSNWKSGSVVSNYVGSQGFQSGNGQVIISYNNVVCTSSRVSDSITVNNTLSPPVLNANPPSTTCGASSNLTGVSAGNIIRWWSAASGGTLLGSTISGANFNVDPTVTTTYYAEAAGSICTSARVAVTVTVNFLNPPSNASASPSSVTCGGATGLTAYSPGNVIRWWTSAVGGTFIGSKASMDTLVVVPATTTYYYAESFNVCSSNTRTSVIVTVNPLPAPSQVTASPNSLNCGGTTNLSAVCSQGSIVWWDSPSGGNIVGNTLSGSAINVAPPYGTTTYYAEADFIGSGGSTINYTGSIVNWSVPSGVFSINIDARGASGGYNGSGVGGFGARMVGTFIVTPGNVLIILAGQCPGSTTLYPGGGGGTYVALGSSYSTATPMVVAGGGGGAYSGYSGANAPTSQAGTYTSGGNYLGSNGYGAIAAPCTGGGGGFYSSGAADIYFTFPGGGGFQQGGAGACAASAYVTTYQCGGFGGGTAANYAGSCNTMGGNGGGYSGGSGYTTNGKYYGEAGGSFNGGTNQQNYSGSSGNTGNGMVIISWGSGSGACISQRVPVTVTLSGSINISSASANPSVIACGSASTLTAASSAGGGSVRWWDSPSGGNLLSSGTSGGNYLIYPVSNMVYYAEAFDYPCTSSSRVSVGVTVNALPPPTTVFALPTTVNCGTSTNLNATTSGGIIRWWDASTGGNFIGTSASQAFLNTLPTISTTYYAETFINIPSTLTFSYSGSYFPFSVPSGVTSISVDARGAQGFSGGASPGGLGGRLQASLAVSPGQTLNIFVGGGGTGYNTGGWNGGAAGFSGGNSGNGGGATDIRIGGTSLVNRILVAGGGAGGGYSCGNDNGGYGGGLSGGGGWTCGTFSSSYSGGGGTQTGGGLGASGGGNPGTLGVGGASTYTNGGGGGGGYYGGGSGYDGGGGGGSGYAGTGTSNPVFTPGFQTGDGQLIFSWIGSQSCISQRVPISTPVTVNTSLPVPTSVVATPSGISCGGSSNLSAVSSGNIIRWWNSQGGGTMLGNSASGGNFLVLPPVTTTYYAESFNVCASATRISVTVVVNPISPPSNVSATPSVLCSSGTSNLNATSSGNIINWWTGSTGGTLLGTGGSFIVTQTSTTTYFAEASSASAGSQTFTYTASAYQLFSVPFGVTSLSVDAAGASGGGYQSGLGGRVQVTLSVVPGQSLFLYVGSAGGNGSSLSGGAGGWNGGAAGGYYSSAYFGGGGGGASDIRTGNTSYTNVVIVAGGGGGSSAYNGGSGGAGGGLSGANGLYSNAQSTAYAGQGGTQTAGGSGASSTPGQSGTLGAGGAAFATGYGGGGGGGYYGGGGGSYGGGGGGSGYAGTGTSNVTQTQGYQSGNGQIVLSWYSSGCVSTRVPVTVTVSSNSTAATSASANPSNINSGASSTLSESGGNLGTGASWNWYTVSCGGTFLNSGLTSIQSPSITTVYYVRAESVCNTTSCVSVTIVVNANSVSATAAYATPAEICPGLSSTLGLTGGSLGAGARWYWYSGSCGSNYVASGASPVLSPSVTTIYYVRAEGLSNTTSCVSATIVTKTLSLPATSASGTTPVCQGGSTTLSLSGGLLGSGAIWNWYSGSCGGVYVSSGINPVLSPTITTTYYVLAQGTCNTTSCANTTIVVNNLSTVPSSLASSSASICSGNAVTLSETGGVLGTNGIWKWYTASCAGTSSGTGVSVTVSPTVSTTYWMRAVGLCNTTSCLSIRVTVNTASTAATSASSSPATICSGSSATLTLSGGTLGTGASWHWYTASCGGTTSGTGVTLIISPTVNTSFYARAENICNTTACVNITINVNMSSIAPSSAVSTPSNICSGDSSTISFNGGTLGTSATWKWYSGSCGGSYIGSGLALLQYPTQAVTYYIRAEGLCNTTSCVSTMISIIQNSVAPVSALASVSVICSGATDSLYESGGSISVGANWFWYSGSCGGTSVGTGSPVAITTNTADTIYYVRAESSCYTTSCASAGLTIIASAIPPSSASSDKNNYCSNIGGTLTLTASGGSGNLIYWYKTSCGGTLVGSGNPKTITAPAQSTVYYVRWQISGCTSSTCISKSITVYLSPTAPATVSFASSGTLCTNSGGTITLSGSGGVGNSFWWYTGSCGGTVAGSGRSLVITAPSVTTQYWGRMQTVYCGNSTCKTVTVLVNTSSSPANSVMTSNTIICAGDTANMTVSGGNAGTSANWYWYTGSCGGTYVSVGLSTGQVPSSSLTYFVRAEGICNTTICVSKTITVNNVPGQPSAISGNSNPLAGTYQQYSVVNDSNATLYTWTYPLGWTGSGNTNSITLHAGTGTGSISVIPSNLCGNGPVRTFVISGGHTLRGNVYYDTTAIPIDSVWVYLMQNSVMIDSVQADINGYYQFTGIYDGTYYINASTHKPWGGVNATDAVKVKRHFAGSGLFTSSIILHAADVNLSYNINTTDAVKITRRFVGSDTSFTRGDWIFEKPLGGDTLSVSVYLNDTVIINGSDLIQNMYAICVGDVNASNVPVPGAKSLPKIDLTSLGSKQVGSNEYFELPISVGGDINIGAISMILKYPKQLVNILSCEFSENCIPYLPAGGSGDLFFNNLNNNETRIGWFENDGSIMLKTNDPLIIIKGKTTRNFKEGDVIKFNIANDPLCEIADEEGNPLDNVILKTYSIEHPGSINNTSAVNFTNITNDMVIFPNPAKNNAIFKYTICTDGFTNIALYNVLGEKIKDLVNTNNLKGTYELQVDLASTPVGVYLCKMTMDGKDVIVKKVIISR